MDTATPSGDDRRRTRTDATLNRALALLLEHDMAGFAGLWAPDGTLEFPFAPPGYPARLAGRAAIADYLSGYTELIDLREVVAQTRHPTLDPDTTILEFEVDARAVRTAKPFRMRYVAVVTVGGDGITSYRDYWSPSAAADALDTGTAELSGTVTGGAR